MYTVSYMEINTNNINYNVSSIIKKYNKYKYYFGVVKADCYNHGAKVCVKHIIEAGVNYLAVANLDEALNIREKYKEISILCFGIVQNKDLELCKKNNITITIPSLEYLNAIDVSNLKKVKVHIKVNTGMNRLGVSSKNEFEEVYEKLRENAVKVEGVYTHIYDAKSAINTEKQIKVFEQIVDKKIIEEVDIIHIPASEALISNNMPKYINGCRLGIAMYGFSSDKSLNLKSTFKLYSSVEQINKLKKGETLGYDASYTATEKQEYIATVTVGYADGIIRKNKGSYVYINDKKYEIVGNVCMDALFVKVDESVRMLDTVEIIRDNKHIEDIAHHTDTIVYEVICNIKGRVDRKYL